MSSLVPPVRKGDSVDYKRGVHAKKTSLLLHASHINYKTVTQFPGLPQIHVLIACRIYLLEVIKNLDIGKGLGLRLREHDSQELHTHVPQEVPSSDSVTQTSE